MEERRANLEAQRLLLRALLTTNEFRDMPARLQHIEKDIVEFTADVSAEERRRRAEEDYREGRQRR